MSILVINDVSPNNLQINNNLTTVTISNDQGIQGPAGPTTSNLSGLIQAGSNVTFGGSGVAGDPFIVNSTGSAAAGLNRQVQYNNSGSLDGSDGLIYDNVNNRLVVTPDLSVLSGGVSSNSSAIFQNATASNVVHVLAGDTNTANIWFGKTSQPSQGRVTYNNSTEVMTFNTNGALAATLSSSGSFTITGTYTAGASSSAVAFQTTSTPANSNFVAVTSAAATSTTAQLLFSGATSISYRVLMRGSTSAAPASGASYTGLIIGQQAATVASTGTHALFAQQVVNPLAVTGGAGSLTNTASIYVNGVSTATVTGANYGIWSTGLNRFGSVTVDTTINGVALTSSGSATSFLNAAGTYTTPAGSGTVTSVAVSGGTTGLTTSGGPITGSGTITLAGTLAVANGGTALTAVGAAKTLLGTNNGTSLVYVASNLDYNNYVLFQDRKTSGTQGGSSSVGTQTRDLTTPVINNITGASLTSNQITLPAGTYYVRASAPSRAGDINKIRLYNVTTASYILEGNSALSRSTADSQTDALMVGAITLAATSVLELRHYIGTAFATTGLGGAISQGTEVYSTFEAWKVT